MTKIEALSWTQNDNFKPMAFEAKSLTGFHVCCYLKWYETFVSWLKEAEWSRSRYAPSIDEYIETGMTSIAVHTMILPACYLASTGLSMHQMDHSDADVITRLLMISSRLLNDMQSYEVKTEEANIPTCLNFNYVIETQLKIENQSSSSAKPWSTKLMA